jgi:hypothetical protein
MMPLSYQGFGMTAILLMIGVLVVDRLFRVLFRYFRKRYPN